MLDRFYKVNLRLCGGAFNGLCQEFCINLVPGEILNVQSDPGAPVHSYVLLEGNAMRKAIKEGVSDPNQFGNAIYVFTPSPGPVTALN